jgi:hypothetical protein
MGHNTTRCRDFDKVVADEVLDRIRNGETIREIVQDLEMPAKNTIWEWENGHLGAPSSWRNDYARARQIQADSFVSDTIAIADLVDETAHIAAIAALDNLPEDATNTEKRRAFFYAKKRSLEAAKLQIDTRRWVASRIAPQRWGDKVTIEHVGDENRPIAVDMSKLSTEQLEQLAGMQHAITDGETVTAEAEEETKAGIRLIAG